MKKFFKRLFLIILFIAVAGIAVVAAMNFHVISEGKKYIRTDSQLENYNADYVVVFGCSVRPGGVLSDMLADRMDKAIELYKAGAGKKILLSGDSQDTNNYDETGNMKKYAISKDVPEEDIIVDAYGLSTYDTVKRLHSLIPEKKEAGELRLVLVTQKYHLYRALLDAKEQGFDAVGSVADLHQYRDQLYNEAREVLGRCKDVTFTLFDLDTVFSTNEKPIGR